MVSGAVLSYSRAEIHEHYNEIDDVQAADEPSDPLLELAAHERGDHGRGGNDETGRNIQQHALILDGEGLAHQQRAQRHD